MRSPVNKQGKLDKIVISYISQQKAHIVRPLVMYAYQNIYFVICQPKHMLWVLKRTVSVRKKHMLKLIDKKIFTCLRSKNLFIQTYALCVLNRGA